MFILAYDFPTNWFVADRGLQDGAVASAQGFVPAVLVLAGLFAVAQLAKSPEVFIWIATLEPLLPAFVLLALSSTLWSASPALTLRFSLPLVVIVVFGYWLVATFRLEQILSTLLAVLAVGTVINYALIFGLPQFGQSTIGWSGVLTDKNTFGRLSAFSALHFAIAYRAFPHLRALWLILWVASVGLVIGSESATSLTGLVGVHVVLVVAQVFRARKTLYGAVALSLVGGGAVGLFIATANLGFITNLLGKDITLTGRTVLWELSLKEAMNRPLLGHGWAAFWQGFLSPARPVIDQNSWIPPHSHNALIDYFLVLGIVGTVLAFSFFVRFVVRSTRAVRYRPGILGLWPLSFASFAILFSITEFGVISRSLFFLFTVVLSSVAALERSAGTHSPSNQASPRRHQPSS